MNQNDISIIKDKIKILNEANWFTIGRASDMAWIGFKAGSNEYALHLQTSFRICKGDKILIANSDMFEPTEELQNTPSFDWNTFNWDVQGFNIFDKFAKQFKIEYGEELTVQKITVGCFGDLKIELDQNVVIEVFINSSKEECWRFFEKGTKNEHLVVTGQGLDF